MKLKQIEFDARLRKTCMDVASRLQLPNETLRPFVCQADPLACSVFVVGTNPRTSDSSFWEYWRPPEFQYQLWSKAYHLHRRKKGLSGTQSNTRRRLGLFADELSRTGPVKGLAAGIHVLETNLWCVPAKNKPSRSLRDPSVFEFLLEAIAPKVIVVHGDPAIAALSDTMGLAIGRNDVKSLASTTVMSAAWHFSGQGSYKVGLNTSESMDNHVIQLARQVRSLFDTKAGLT